MKEFNISVSSLRNLSCARLYQFSSIWRLAPDDEVFKVGTALHRYRELADKGTPKDILSIAKEEEIKDPGALYVASLSLDQQPWPEVEKDNTNNLFVEWEFGFPYKTINDQWQVNLRGIIDRLDIPDDMVRVLDYKSTRKGNPAEAFLDWSTQAQLPFYIYVLTKWLAHLLPPRIRDLVTAGRIFGQHCGIFISLKPPAVKMSPCTFVSPHDFDDMEWLLDDLILKAVNIHELGDRLAYPEGKAYGLCAKCNFLHICAHKDPDKQKQAIVNHKRL